MNFYSSSLQVITQKPVAPAPLLAVLTEKQKSWQDAGATESAAARWSCSVLCPEASETVGLQVGLNKLFWRSGCA